MDYGTEVIIACAIPAAFLAVSCAAVWLYDFLANR